MEELSSEKFSSSNRFDSFSKNHAHQECLVLLMLLIETYSNKFHLIKISQVIKNTMPSGKTSFVKTAFDVLAFDKACLI